MPVKTTISNWLLPRLQDVFFLAIFVGVLALGQRLLNTDGDLPRHLAMGRRILQTGSVPATEPFAYPYFGSLYVSHEWLAELILFIVYNAAGLVGIVLLSAALLACTFTLLYAELSAHLNLRLPVLVLVAWGAAASSLNWIARPHLFSMLFLAIWLVWAGRLERGEKFAIWPFPVLMIVWSNLHGEFIAGILVMLAYTAGAAWDYLAERSAARFVSLKKFVQVLLLSGLATFFNPGGFSPWLAMFSFVSNRYLMSRMAEANPPDFSQPGFYILLALLAFSIVLLAIKKERLSAGQAFLLAGFSAMSLIAARNIHLYGVVAPFVLASAAGGLITFAPMTRLEHALQRIESRLAGVLWPVLVLLSFSVFFLANAPARQAYHFDNSFFPVQAVQWLETHPQPGNLFNNLDWGGYLELKLWPAHPAFVDSVVDKSGTLTREFETAATASDGWQAILVRYNVAWVILPPGSPLVVRLAADPGWATVYSDATATILSRK